MNDSKQGKYTEEERREIIKAILYLAKPDGFLTADEYADALNQLQNISDEELKNALCMTNSNESESEPENETLSQFSFMTDEKNKEILDYMDLRLPETHFWLENGASNDLYSFAIKMAEDNNCEYLLTDLLLSGNISFTDCCITEKNKENAENGGEPGTNSFRFTIFENYKDILMMWDRLKEEDQNVVCIGIITLYTSENGKKLYIPIGIINIDGCKTICQCMKIGYNGLTPQARNKIIHSTDFQAGMSHLYVPLFATWYGLQAAYLDPELKQFFHGPEEEITLCDNPDKSSRDKLKLHYMNKYVINGEDIEKITGDK